MFVDEFVLLTVRVFTTLSFCLFMICLIISILRETHIPIIDVSKQHNWKSARKETRAYYCSICEALLLNTDGLMCDCCGVCTDPPCVKIADKQLKCKAISLNTNKPMKHHWIEGNLPLIAICEVCNEECDMEPGLTDWWCCWCQRSVHEDCKPNLSEICDFGKFKLMIIPPSSLEVANQRTVLGKLQLRTVIPPNWPHWNPLIVIVNKKSGNKDGAEILSSFRGLLNPAQVIDVSECDPVAALKWCRLLGKVKCTVLIAGGDGTISWLLSTIYKLNLESVPSVVTLPLGTGNDLSRVLGWGKEHDPHRDPTYILQKIQAAQEVKLDRWSVTITPYSALGLRGYRQLFYMYNYIGIGVDAQVTLQFHRTRESRFFAYSNRLLNKLLYLCFGTQQVVERECKDLDKSVELYLDGVKMDLPSIEGIVISNIPSWGGGVNLWNTGGEEYGKQSFNDKKLEVIALYSSFHMAQLQVGLSQPYRIGQAKSIKMRVQKSYALHVDGEPWYEDPCEIDITYCNKASMLMNTVSEMN